MRIKTCLMMTMLAATASAREEAEPMVLAGLERAMAAVAACGPDLADALHPVELAGFRSMDLMFNYRAIPDAETGVSEDMGEALAQAADFMPEEFLSFALAVRERAEALRNDSGNRVLAGMVCSHFGLALRAVVESVEVVGDVRVEGDVALIEIRYGNDRDGGRIALVRDAFGWRTIDLIELLVGASVVDESEESLSNEPVDPTAQASAEREAVERLRERVRNLGPAPFELPMSAFESMLMAVMHDSKIPREELHGLRAKMRVERLQQSEGMLDFHDAFSLYHELNSAVRHGSSIDDAVGSAASNVDMGRIVESLIHAAESGNVSAAGILGEIHTEGHWLPRDLDAAVVWLEVAAKGGDNTSANRLADLYYGLESALPIDCGKTLDAFVNIDPDHAWGVDARKAWVLATCPDAEFRDGKRALAIASEHLASDQARFGGDSFDTDLKEAVAAAYCEMGDFELALLTMDEIMDRNTCGIDPGQLKRWEMYGAQQCWRGPRD